MNSVSDKLMRLLQTKKDIMEALVEKGLAVDESTPFADYASLIRQLPGKESEEANTPTE